jgi:serine/threonine-protein kinase
MFIGWGYTVNDLTGQEIDGYQLEERLGQRAHSTVYRARKLSNNRLVIFKILTADAQNPEFMGRFMREMNLMEEFDHPNIAPILAWGIAVGDLPYLIRDFIPGQSLREIIDSRRLSPQAVGKYLKPITSALGYIHDKDITHRDVTPNNLIVAEDEQVYLTDFGFGKHIGADTSFTGSNVVVGTPEYASPEAVDRQPLDQRSDLYNLAVVTYEMLLGRLPFQNKQSTIMIALAHAKQPPPEPRSIHPDFPLPLQAFLLKGLAKNPDDRYQWARDYLAGYEAALAELSEDERQRTY